MNKKTLLCAAASAVAALCLMLVPGGRAQALEMTPIAPNVATVGQLESIQAEKYYSFTVDQTGYFSVTLAPEEVTANVKDGWKMGLYNALDGSLVTEYTNIKSAKTTQDFGFQQGQQFYLKIEPQNPTLFFSPAGVKYKLTVTTTASTCWEQEYNDTPATARTIVPYTTYYGNLYSAKDVDYYAYTVGADGTQVITFAPVAIGSNVLDGWEVEVYDGASYAFLYSYSVKTRMSFPAVDFKKGTKLLIKVKSKNTTYFSPIGVNYSLDVYETADNGWEKENFVNSTAGWGAFSGSATSVSSGSKCNGTLWSGADEDLYKVVLKKNGTLKMEFTPNDVATNLGNGYTVTILNSSGKEIKKENSVKSKISQSCYLGKGTYYVKVEAYTKSEYFAPVNTIYEVAVKATPYTPAKVASVKASGAKISWKKQNKASGYEVSYATKASFSGAKKVTATKNNVKLTLKKGKTYYVRVRAYKTTENKKQIYGGWSKAVKVTIKK